MCIMAVDNVTTTFTEQRPGHDTKQRGVCIEPRQRVCHGRGHVGRVDAAPLHKELEVVVRRAPQCVQRGVHAVRLLGKEVERIVFVYRVNDTLL